MNWQHATPWRRRAMKDNRPRTAEQQLAAIEKLCRAGDLSLGAAIKQAYHVGMNEQQAEPAAIGKESDGLEH